MHDLQAPPWLQLEIEHAPISAAHGLRKGYPESNRALHDYAFVEALLLVTKSTFEHARECVEVVECLMEQRLP